MESVPVDFCKRVSAQWNCCKYWRGFICKRFDPLPIFEAAKWILTKPIAVKFYLETDGERWKYGFSNPDYDRERHTRDSGILNAGELTRLSYLMHIRVVEVEISERNDHAYLKSLDVDLEKLLKFTSCLMDEPNLERNTNGPNVFENTAPDGAVIRKWLDEGWFHKISMRNFTAADQSQLDRRRRGGKPIEFTVSDVSDDARAILQDYLKSGRLRHLFLCDLSIIPFEVMETIIENFRRNPEEWTLETLYIHAKFDETTKGKLEELREKGLCHFKGDSLIDSWVFEVGQKSLRVNTALKYRWNHSKYSIRIEHWNRS